MVLLSLTKVSCCTILWRHQFCSSSIVRDLAIADENNALTSLHKFAFVKDKSTKSIIIYIQLHSLIILILQKTPFAKHSYCVVGTVSSLETCLNILIDIPMTCLHLGNVRTSVKLSLEIFQCSVTPPSCGFSN